ncbi:hypothetical protein QBC35DRAFT_374403 [Podospora australis]|uniref:Uncharacterized protein n=1 Tax=Podospora australis TaxID=1536484 RepID=A0AAN7AM07_9PEZI|nr:hypothetical protein QBC35DRAFT_374403 [Podospora australis]
MPLANNTTSTSTITNTTDSNNTNNITASNNASPARASTSVSAAAVAAAAANNSNNGSSTRGKAGNARGGGRSTRGGRTTKVSKPTQAKPPAGRGRRQKVYDSSRAQAAHERTQELRSAYSALMKILKPAAQELAERSISDLLEDPTIHERAPEYGDVLGFLQERHADATRKFGLALQHGINMAEHVYKGEQEAAREAFARRVEELTEDRLGELLQELERVELLHSLRLPIDLPAATNSDYTYKVITMEEHNSLGIFFEKRDGIEVPFSGTSLKDLMVKPITMPLESAKRKADGQPEGQPAPKHAATAKEEESGPPLPRNAASLLGGVEAIEDAAGTPPDSGSNAPNTPLPDLADDVPEVNGHVRASAEGTAADAPDLPLPRGALPPDEYGVRLIARRSNRAADAYNNRIVLPNLFEFDELDVGFRDSTNSAQKGATKARRGKYLEKPNSNFMFVDRKCGIWDATEAAGELDEALVKKHNLHPKYGLFLPSSVNYQEEPKPHVDGWKPVCLVAPNGQVTHASRTIPAARRDLANRKAEEEVEAKIKIHNLLKLFEEEEGISNTDLVPSSESVQQRRREELLARDMDPDADYEPSPTPAAPTPAPEPLAEDTSRFDRFADEALRAAAELEAQQEVPRAAVPKVTPQPSTRPGYDAIRDIFTDSSPTQHFSQPSVPTAPAISEPAPPADTANLAVLADTAMQQGPSQPTIHNHQQPNGIGRPHECDHQNYPAVEHVHSVEYGPQPEYPPIPFVRPVEGSAPAEPARSNDFLRTALNPPAAYPPPPGGPMQEYQDASFASAGSQASQAAGSRTPISNGASVGLPALRPVRNLLNDSPPPQSEAQTSPAMQQGNMVITNSGAYYPPAPARPFHNGFSVQEPLQHLQPLQPQMLPGPLQAPPLPGPPPPLAPIAPRQTSPYRESPPPYQNIHPQLAPAPTAGIPILPAGSQPSPHSRPGSSSASIPAPVGGSATASSKYRKLEPAPTPPHRMTYTANGTELRTVPFDYREAIKDYSAVEAPPRHGPTQIRGWTHNNIRKARPSSARGDGNPNTDESA